MEIIVATLKRKKNKEKIEQNKSVLSCSFIYKIFLITYLYSHILSEREKSELKLLGDFYLKSCYPNLN